jgi:phosphonatase-like hydrolase
MESTMAVQLVVCDLAGTTVHDNQDVHKVLQRALAEHGVHISLSDANEVMGIPKPVAIEKLLAKRYTGSRRVDEFWIHSIHNDFVRYMIDFYTNDESVKEKEGASETFRKLKESKLKIVVDTGFDRPITNPLLERLGWEREGLIDGSVTSDEVERGRPYPDMIYKAMEIAGVSDVQAVAKVGDTTSDLQEGKAAGCRYVIGVTTGAFSKAELEREFHTHLVSELKELIPIIT